MNKQGQEGSRTIIINDINKFTEHLTFWHNKSDDECIALATNENGLDAEQALMNMMERDFVTEMNNDIFEDFRKKLEV
jgi:hypothetical protein